MRKLYVSFELVWRNEKNLAGKLIGKSLGNRNANSTLGINLMRVENCIVAVKRLPGLFRMYNNTLLNKMLAKNACDEEIEVSTTEIRWRAY